MGDSKMNAILMRLYRWNWIPYLIVAVLGGWTMYDAFFPVVWMKGKVISTGPDHVVLHMSGWKLRECEYLGIQAYSVKQDGIRDTRTQIRRIDTNALGVSRPVGYYDLGQWEIRPTSGAIAVVVYAQHSCDKSDLRSTKMAEVAL